MGVESGNRDGVASTDVYDRTLGREPLGRTMIAAAMLKARNASGQHIRWDYRHSIVREKVDTVSVVR